LPPPAPAPLGATASGTGDYLLYGLDVNLYKAIEATWEERQVANGVQVPVPKAVAISPPRPT
jgi:hypothetical protein